MKIIAIRPEPGLSATLAAGRELGLDMAGWPLFEIRSCDWPVPEGEIDGLLVGSANAIRHGGEGFAALRGKPVYAVGETSADAAREAGFEVATVGEGGLQPLLDTLAGRKMRLLRLAGADRVVLHPPTGIELVTRTVYESAALPMPGALADALREGALVLVHSAIAVRHLGEECDRNGISRVAVSLAALSPRIAEAAGPGWARVKSVEAPRETALLALARDMCH